MVFVGDKDCTLSCTRSSLRLFTPCTSVYVINTELNLHLYSYLLSFSDLTLLAGLQESVPASRNLLQLYDL